VSVRHARGTVELRAAPMDARYTTDPADVFSVEAEVRELMRNGKF